MRERRSILLLVPLSTNLESAVRDLTVARADENHDNGLAKRSYALAHIVTGTARSRVCGYLGAIEDHQFATLRALVRAANGGLSGFSQD